MIEDALQLPGGYSTLYEERGNSETKSYMALGWGIVSKVFRSSG
jgi:hypothetical protein